MDKYRFLDRNVINNNMANRNVNNLLLYWFDGSSSTSIKTKPNTYIGLQSYWINGSPTGYIGAIPRTPVPRTYAILIGF